MRRALARNLANRRISESRNASMMALPSAVAEAGFCPVIRRPYTTTFFSKIGASSNLAPAFFNALSSSKGTILSYWREISSSAVNPVRRLDSK